jgi:putative heme-binding domain-containing protein
VRQELVSFLTSSPKTALELFKRMETGEISRALVDIETRWRFQRGSGELRDLAIRLFGQASTDRAAVVDSYLEASRLNGDAGRGMALFSALCVTCHRKGEIGADVGPSLADVKAKAPEALLSDILDPNRMFEARYCAYQCSLKDGRSFVGLVSSESEESVTLTLAGGSKEVLQRSAILEMKSLERSLMPTGLEAALSKSQMADLLMFLRQQ